MKNKVFLNFAINDFDDISHDEISRALDMTPYKIYIKGTKRIPHSNSPNPALWSSNRWIMANPLSEFYSFKDQMDATLDILEPKIAILKNFCEKYDCEFICAIYLRFNNGESTPSIYLDSRYNRLIKELNVKFNIDLYNLPDNDNEN